MKNVSTFLVSVGVVLVAAGSGVAGTTIVVNYGRHASPAVAAHSEAKVNWHDADTTDDTACTESFAAVELQRCFRHVTGRPKDFVIAGDKAAPGGDLLLVGLPGPNAAGGKLAKGLGVTAGQLTGLGPEGYRIRSAVIDGRRVTLLAGGGRVGTLYAAYDLLHRLGWRWFAPEAVHEVPPKARAIGDLDVTARPTFLTRGFHAWEDRGQAALLLWMARNRLNYWCSEERNHPLMRKLGIRMSCGGHTAQARFLNPASPYPYNHPRFASDDDKPADPYPPSGDYRGDTDKDGKLSIFEAHPEWFPLVGNKRLPGLRGGEFGTNYCTSNPHAVGEFMKRFAQSLIDGVFRDADVVRFWTLDGGKWCACGPCKALGTPTDRNLLLVHALDREIKRARAAGRIHRPITIRFLAYADVLAPPTRPLPKDFDYQTCSATFFPIVRCYVHAFGEAKCSRNAHYVRQLHGWATDAKRHYRGRLCIGEYYNVSGYKCLPLCFMHSMARDIPYYAKVGARHFHYMHVVTRAWGNLALTNYQMARQLWDVRTDCKALWQDYFAKRYGPAAGTMRRFYETLEKMLCNVSRLKYGLAGRLNSGAKGLFPESHLRYERTESVACDGVTFVEIVEHACTCRKLIQQAMATEAPKLIKARIAEDERRFTYGERTVLYYDACVGAYQLIRAGKTDQARPHYARAQRLADLLRKDVTSTRWSSSHANAPNALAASRAEGAVSRLAALLTPPKVRSFDTATQPFVLTGLDFSGGGAIRYGHTLHLWPQRKMVSNHGNFVYASPTGELSRMSAVFDLKAVPKAPMSLTLVGLSYPAKGRNDVPAEILVNGSRIYEGPAPFTSAALTTKVFALPAGVLRKGHNTLTLRNTAPAGPTGNRPWFGIDRAELRIVAEAR